MQYMSSWNREHLDNVSRLNNEMEARVSKSREELDAKVEEARASFKNDIEKTREDYEKKTLREIEKSSQALQKDYVSILGIFAAIVMAFISGSVYSNSVLDNVASTELYRLLFVMLCVGLFIFDLVIALFYFVLKMSGLQMGKRARKFLYCGNGIAVLLIAVLIVNWYLHFLPVQ